jgi:hypothetical protein
MSMQNLTCPRPSRFGYIPGTATKSWSLAGANFTQIGGTWFDTGIFRFYNALSQTARNVSMSAYVNALEIMWRSGTNPDTVTMTNRPNHETLLKQMSHGNAVYTVRPTKPVKS